MLTEQDFASALRDTLDDATGPMQPSTDLSAAVRGRLRSRHRRIVATRMAAVPLLAAVTVGAVTLWPQTHAPRPDAAATPTPAGGHSAPTTNTSTPSIELAGYRLSFPAAYKLGAPDTNCTANLHLSADEKTRLITTPDAACPLLIKSVLSELPAGAIKDEVRGTEGVRPDGSPAGSADPGRSETYYRLTADGATLYVPAKLPGGDTVYVTVEWGTSGFDGAQLVELETGLHVESMS
jgi:hypothetical protein